jgi:hypothetical protein
MVDWKVTDSPAMLAVGSESPTQGSLFSVAQAVRRSGKAKKART